SRLSAQHFNQQYADSIAEKDVYDLQWKKELFISLPVAGLFVGNLFIEPQVLLAEELDELDIKDVPWFERNIIFFDSTTAAQSALMSDYFNKASVVVGLVSVLSAYKVPKEIPVNFILYVEGLYISSGLTDLLKKSVGRIRPYAYNVNYSDDYRIRGGAAQSFPSGHTSSSSFNCFFAAKMIDDYLIDDESKLLKTINWTVAALVPAWVGYLRMEAGVHFLTDVVAGYTIGATCGMLIPELHKLNNDTISFYPINFQEYTGISCMIRF
ncbi:MAG: phosphatase PAP2 family protein, partial [Chitinophagales bacterium]